MGLGLSTEIGEESLYYQNKARLEDILQQVCLLCWITLVYVNVTSQTQVIDNDETIEELDLSNTYIGEDGISQSSDALQSNTSIKNLNLSYNKLSDNALGILCHSLSRHPIEVLNISGNAIGDAGSAFLEAFLLSNLTLEVLTLYNCNLNDQSVLPIANGLQQNNNLRSLDLRMNHITDIGGSFFLQCFSHNKALAELNLESNKVSDTVRNQLSEKLSEHRQHQAVFDERRRERREQEADKREKDEAAKLATEKRCKEERENIERQQKDMEERERELQEEEDILRKAQNDNVIALKTAAQIAQSKRKEYINIAIDNSYNWRDKIQAGSRAWQSGFTVKPVNNDPDVTVDMYGTQRRLQPCWCEPTDAPAGYSGQLHYHCKYELEPDTFHDEDQDTRKYEGCKRTGHPCVSVGVYAKPLHRDTAATFFSSRSPHQVVDH